MDATETQRRYAGEPNPHRDGPPDGLPPPLTPGAEEVVLRVMGKIEWEVWRMRPPHERARVCERLTAELTRLAAQFR